MKKELIINAGQTDVEIALLEDSKLVEIHRQKHNVRFNVGDIFLGRVKKLMPGLNAAFIDIGNKRDAFLHYTDLGPNLRSVLKWTKQAVAGQNSSRLDHFEFEPEIIKTGKINEVLNKNEFVLCQILKEPISTKGPRLSCEITIPGRYLVLTPFNNFISISKRVSNSEERKRLKILMESIKPKNFGVILRTAAEGKKVADLHREVRELEIKWEQIHQQLKHATPPKKLLAELDKASSILRDLLTEEFNSIVVNDKEAFNTIQTLLKTIAPDRVKILKYYKSPIPIFSKYGVSRQIKSSFGKTSTLKSGTYIVIEHTEAMHVVDVNSGPKSQRQDQESSALKVNLEAAEEIARQMRLRDLGGIILVDFIDMRKSENKKRLYDSMREFMKNDRAQHTILPLSKFGLMQITRQRVKPEIEINTTEKCPTCNGTGTIDASILILDNIERDMDFILSSKPKAKLSIKVHPFLEAYLKKGWPSPRMKWYFKYNKWIRIVSDEDFGLLHYSFYDRDDEIRLSQS